MCLLKPSDAAMWSSTDYGCSALRGLWNVELVLDGGAVGSGFRTARDLSSSRLEPRGAARHDLEMDLPARFHHQCLAFELSLQDLSS